MTSVYATSRHLLSSVSAALVMGTLIWAVSSSGGFNWRGPSRASAHGSYCYASNYGSYPPDNQVGAANSYIFGLCATVGSGQYFQQSGSHYVSQAAGYGNSWYYVQHNPDEYVQEQLNGPPCTSASGYPACSYYGAWDWFLYWQRNPDNWKSEQVNTWPGGPYYWHRTGWF